MTQKEIFDALTKVDTPTITNVVATYPNAKTCLGLYNPWTENWYTDQSIRCMYPELGRTVGYAVTCVYGLPDPNYARLSFMDVLEALEASKKPTILIIQREALIDLNRLSLSHSDTIEIRVIDLRRLDYESLLILPTSNGVAQRR